MALQLHDSTAPPFKKRRLMVQSTTDPSYTPSPPITPRSNHNHNNGTAFASPLIKRIPHVDSTPIRNYFARFTNHAPISNRPRKIQKAITPKRLLNSPFASPLQFDSQRIDIDATKYDSLYHPLTHIITNRIDLNIFSESYSPHKAKQCHDKHPFFDPALQLQMRDKILKMLCDTKDKKQSDDDSDDAANEMVQTYGDTAITKMLDGTDTCHEDADTAIHGAKQLIQYLQNNDASSSYEDIKKGMMHLGGVLECITAVVLDSAGLIAQRNHSVTDEREDHHAEIVRNTMNNHREMVSPYDEDMFRRDIKGECVMIRPSHVRQAIAEDDGLFWLQQAIQTNGTGRNNNNDDIEEALNADCVYHICSFFCGDLPMLSSLARVNSTFYVMTARNNLWKPIAIRCFLFNPMIVAQIEENYKEDSDGDEEEECYDFRGYISLEQHVKWTVLRERWIKQDVNSETFELFVRINPVYDLQTKVYNVVYMKEDVDLWIDDETYDCLRQLLEIFGTNDFMTVSDIINHAKCFTHHQMQRRFAHVFENSKLSAKEESDLNTAMQIEYQNCYHQNQRDAILFVQLPLSQSCIHKDAHAVDDEDKHYLWIGANISIFAIVPHTEFKYFTP